MNGICHSPPSEPIRMRRKHYSRMWYKIVTNGLVNSHRFSSYRCACRHAMFSLCEHQEGLPFQWNLNPVVSGRIQMERFLPGERIAWIYKSLWKMDVFSQRIQGNSASKDFYLSSLIILLPLVILRCGISHICTVGLVRSTYTPSVTVHSDE